MRLVTRSDFDGLVCAALLKHVEDIDEIKFVHPKDLQDGKFEVTSDDVLANVPYVPGCGMWFDHHSTEIERVVGKIAFKGECRLAPSAARVIFDYYGGSTSFPNIDDLMIAVDKADSAQFSRDDILNPKGWDLLSFVMDARTGLGRFKDYRISNYQLMFNLIDMCMHESIDNILKETDVVERLDRYYEQDTLFRAMLSERTSILGNVIVTDLRGVETIYAGNRFLVYALNPEQNISMWIVDGFRKSNCVFACGHSIVNKTSTVDIGVHMRRYGGGGHKPAGTCQVDYDTAEDVLQDLVSAFNAGSPGMQQAA